MAFAFDQPRNTTAGSRPAILRNEINEAPRQSGDGPEKDGSDQHPGDDQLQVHPGHQWPDGVGQGRAHQEPEHGGDDRLLGDDPIDIGIAAPDAP